MTLNHLSGGTGMTVPSGQHMLAGTVVVSNDADSLYVSYNARAHRPGYFQFLYPENNTDQNSLKEILPMIKF